MFEHVMTLISFVFAIALTHLLFSASELISARDRVRFSPLLAIWMFNSLIGLVVNWLSYWGLNVVKHWAVSDVLMIFIPTIVQYFTCSLVAMKAEAEGPVDMEAFYRRQRAPIAAAYLAMVICSMVQNYVYRDSTAGLTGNDWVFEDLLIVPMALAAIAGGWGRPRWLQWAGALLMCVSESYFMVIFAITS